MNIIYKYLLITAFVGAVNLLMPNQSDATQHPNLVVNQTELSEMRTAAKGQGSFAKAFAKTKASVDKQMRMAMDVPVPADGGGGYTHERHKKNYQLIYSAGIIYQLSQDEKYAYYVRDMLLA